MAHGDRERVRCVRTDAPGKVEQRRDHVGYLGFLRSSRTNQRELYRARRVFKHGQPLRHRTQGRPARLPELQGAFHIAVDEYALDRDFGRLMLADESLQAIEDQAQALRHDSAADIETPVSDMHVIGSAAFDYAKTRAP